MPARRAHRVIWSEAATIDLVDIASFIADDSPARARQLLAKLRRRARSLRHFPLRGRLVPELAHFGIHAWRELIENPYRIVYRIAEDAVVVQAVLDGRRELTDILLDRLVRTR
ncbi:MAG: type II toxin-antitoxin system RelE/ParE family toxin [Acidobacteria bacterium]|nr:type II toxin-antitoxin system RelE/ParE family toxin [Acidobacteriota bacterium]